MTKQQEAVRPAGIVLSDVTKSYGGVTVLDRLSLTLLPVGVTALMGASGRGKTTLCSLLLGLEKPDAGEIHNPYKRISSAFQDPRLFPWLTAEENVMLVLSGIPKKEKREKADALLTRLGLGDALKKRPSELSGGMQQRVSLARAFLLPHDMLILDEPFRGLDDENKSVVMDLIREEAARLPVLLVTHDKSDADALSASVILLT